MNGLLAFSRSAFPHIHQIYLNQLCPEYLFYYLALYFLINFFLFFLCLKIFLNPHLTQFYPPTTTQFFQPNSERISKTCSECFLCNPSLFFVSSYHQNKVIQFTHIFSENISSCIFSPNNSCNTNNTRLYLLRKIEISYVFIFL